MKRLGRTYLVAALISLAGCSANGLVSTESGQLVIPGTGDSQDVLRLLEKAYEARNPNVDIVIPDSTGSFATKEGTLGGLESAGTRTTELGRTAVRPREVDLKKFGPMYYREFARVPVVFVVHSDVSVKAISGEQICSIFSGAISNWSAVGGPDQAIAVQARPEGSNMLAIRQALPCFKDLQVTPSAHNNLRNSDAVASIRDIPGSIGFMPLSEARQHGFKVLMLDGKEALAADYPVVISLGLVHMDPLRGLAKDFVEFLASLEAARILRQSSHIPIAAPSVLVRPSIGVSAR
jgi:phosphate transport system substrate-binding protein